MKTLFKDLIVGFDFYILRKYRNLGYQELSFLRRSLPKTPSKTLGNYILLNIIEYNLNKLENENNKNNPC